MVKGHWQIASGAAGTERRYGRVEAVPLDAVPPAVLKAGVAAGAIIGKGLYGVDVKEIGGEPRVIEVNDNPNLDAGHEDGVLGEELYLAIMRHFVRLIEARGSVG
jgi:glutathione synthase/RimK-type ligase-like ATP-grasp enzyme